MEQLQLKMLGMRVEEMPEEGFRSVNEARLIAHQTLHNTPNNNDFENNIFAKSPSQPYGTTNQNSFTQWFNNDNTNSVETMNDNTSISQPSLTKELMCAEVSQEKPILISETVISIAEPVSFTPENINNDSGLGMDIAEQPQCRVATSLDTYSYSLLQRTPICMGHHML